MKLFTIGVVLMLMVAPIAAAGQAPATGMITGTVENLTGGRRPVAGQLVKLTAYVNNAEADWKEMKTDAQGRFSFSVPASTDRAYVVNVKYKGGDYDSDQMAFKPGETRKQLAMRVYEPTTDVSILRVNVHHVIVEIGEGMVQVAELMVFTNPTDRTYIGAKERSDGKRETLLLRLPGGASDLQYMEGLMECCVFATESGLVDTMDVKPGIRQIAYSYTIPTSRRELAVRRALDYPTDRVEVFGNTAAQLTVSPLERKEPVTTEQGTYARFSSGALAAGTEITIGLSGLPLPRSSTRRLAAAAFAGVIAAALAYPLLRRSRAPKPTKPVTRDELVAAIAALDNQFEAGQISEPEYQAQRARYKKRLMEMLEE